MLEQMKAMLRMHMMNAYHGFRVAPDECPDTVCKNAKLVRRKDLDAMIVAMLEKCTTDAQRVALGTLQLRLLTRDIRPWYGKVLI